MTSAPFFSIIVPVYNHERYIGAALDSILAQTEPSWEAIVVDDGSTDGTAAIVDAYADRDVRIKVVRKANGGVASALNAGLEWASGRWVHWLSSDDLFEPDKLTINRRWIAEYPAAKFFFSYFTLLRESTGEMEQRGLWGPIPHPEHQVLTLLYRNFVSGITICVERAAWEQVGRFDPSLRFGQDYDMWLRFLQCFQGVFIPEWTVVNRNHAAQGSEVFPEACYFDTAKAGIRFLNRYRFTELIPWTNLGDREAVTAAVSQALDIACEPSAFLYCLGVHPALILRVLEWVWSDEIPDAELAASLRRLVQRRIQGQAFAEGRGDWHHMWRELAAVSTLAAPRFTFQPIDPRTLARSEHARRRAEGRSSATPLCQYLAQYEGAAESAITPDGAGSGCIVLFSITPSEQILRLAQGLIALGYRPVVLISQGVAAAWSHQNGVVFLERHPRDWDSLPWLGTVELAVGLANETVPAWIDAVAVIELGVDAADPLAAILGALHSLGGPNTRRPVVFLERALKGGGAERVVRDIAGRLDRRRYRPVVLTLFDGPADPDFPRDVATFCVHGMPADPAPRVLARLVGTDPPAAEPAPAATEPMASAAEPSPLVVAEIQEDSGAATSAPAAVPLDDPQPQQADPPVIPPRVSVKRRLLLAGRALYHWLLSYEQREKLMLGQRLSGARDGLRSIGPRSRAGAVRLRVLLLGPGADQRCPPLPPGTFESLPPPICEPAQPPTWEPSPRQFACLQTLDNYWPKAEALHNTLRQLDADTVVITVMEEAAVTAWMAQQMAGFPFVASLHTVESTYLPVMYPEPLRLDVERWAFSSACRMAERVTTPSKACSADMVCSFGLDPGHLATMPNPLPCASIRRLAWAEDQLAEDWKKMPGLRLVNVARLDEQKNHELLLQACARLRRAGIAFSLWLLGEGPYRSEIEASIARLSLQSEVRLLGYVENPYPLVAAADVFLLSSNFEAFALVLVEAMICETPIISVSCVAGPREILDEGRCGILVPPNDPQALAEAIRRLASDDDLRAGLIASGLNRAVDFDVSRVVPQWQRLIDSLPLGRSAGAPPSATRYQHDCAEIVQ